MEFRTRAGLALVLLGCFLGGMVALDTFGETFFPESTAAPAPGILIDKVFSRAGFQLRSQSWRPGYDPLGIGPGEDVLGNEELVLDVRRFERNAGKRRSQCEESRIGQAHV